jgi:hypothetical protein
MTSHISVLRFRLHSSVLEMMNVWHLRFQYERYGVWLVVGRSRRPAALTALLLVYVCLQANAGMVP